MDKKSVILFVFCFLMLFSIVGVVGVAGKVVNPTGIDDRLFVADAYHSFSGCAAGYTTVNTAVHGGRYCTDTQYVCVKYSKLYDSNYFVQDVVVGTGCPSGYTPDSGTLHGGSYGLDNVYLCRKYIYRNLTTGELPESTSSLLLNFQMIISDTTGCPSGFGQTSTFAHGGGYCTDPYRACIVSGIPFGSLDYYSNKCVDNLGTDSWSDEINKTSQGHACCGNDVWSNPAHISDNDYLYEAMGYNGKKYICDKDTSGNFLWRTGEDVCTSFRGNLLASLFSSSNYIYSFIGGQDGCCGDDSLNGDFEN